jgi:hypothetical protein
VVKKCSLRLCSPSILPPEWLPGSYSRASGPLPEDMVVVRVAIPALVQQRYTAVMSNRRFVYNLFKIQSIVLGVAMSHMDFLFIDKLSYLPVTESVEVSS